MSRSCRFAQLRCRSGVPAAIESVFSLQSSGFRPCGRGTFSCVPKRKYPKRRAPGALIGWRRCPAFLANLVARATRSFMGSACRPHKTCLEQGAHLFPDWLWYSVSATGQGCFSLTPLAQPSIAGILRVSEPFCRAGFASRRRGKCCESGERSKYREAQGTRVSGQAVGPRFFWVLFFGGAKKSTSPFRAKPEVRKENDSPIAAGTPLLHYIRKIRNNKNLLRKHLDRHTIPPCNHYKTTDSSAPCYANPLM